MTEWTPTRLRELALLVSPPSRRKLRYDGLEEAAAALRDFATVVSLVDGLDTHSRANAVSLAPAAGGGFVAQLYDTYEGDWSEAHGRGPTRLAAVLALAGRIEGGEGSDG